ncbi:hypothetical protein VMCG_06150 [Cytospora schulzeri]|uniref:Clr5 domain-containing protein n=1 Tax=Cytospora schulzeri TaxID=448051 RepID=A0A423WGQ5_9PEZI|nr:hypothetical protein VMCG_06150 [Valsa malicola]
MSVLSSSRMPILTFRILLNMNIMASITSSVITSSVPFRTRPSASRYANKYDWDRHMSTIKRLYMDENMTLREVMDIMEKQYNFFATVKMYKVRLRRWGCSKYIKTKAEDVASLPDLLLNEGELQGPVQLASGRVVDAERLTSHLLRKRGISVTTSRKGSQPSEIHGVNDQGPSPSDMAVNPPDIFYVSEAILADTRNYVSGRLMSNKAFVSKGGCATIVSTFYSIRDLLRDGNLDEAVSLLRQAPKQMDSLLRYEPPRILEHLFMIIAHLRDIPGEQVSRTVRALVRYAAAAAAADLGWPPQHPLRRILSAFAILSEQDAPAQYDLATRGWKCLIEMLDCQLGTPECSSSNFSKWLDLGDSCGYDALPGTYLAERQWRVYREVAAGYGPGSPEAVKELFYVTELERQRVEAGGGSGADLEQLVEWTLRSIPEESECTKKYNCESYLADFHKEKKKKQIDLAERHLRARLDTRIELYATAASNSGNVLNPSLQANRPVTGQTETRHRRREDEPLPQPLPPVVRPRPRREVLRVAVAVDSRPAAEEVVVPEDGDGADEDDGEHEDHGAGSRVALAPNKCDGEGQKNQGNAADEDRHGGAGMGHLQGVAGDLEAAEYGEIAPADPGQAVEAMQEQDDGRCEEE